MKDYRVEIGCAHPSKSSEEIKTTGVTAKEMKALNDSSSTMFILTPAKERGQTPSHGVDPGSGHKAQCFLVGHRSQRG